MALDVVTEEIEETKTSKHEPASTEDIKIENLIILKTIGTGAENGIQKLYNINQNFHVRKICQSSSFPP